MKKRLLLAAVFGPYGVKNRYAEALGMQMELLNNQITRAQGVHSPRQSYWTFPLYFLAENIKVETTVLDFPSWGDFKRELAKGYTHVGINFIIPNVLKAQRMARYIRKHHPETVIILGGYGSAIPDLQSIVPHDELCRGEGIRWLRKYFGEDPDAPLRHPVIHGPAYEYLYGAKGRPRGAILMPGVGCENACKFCATSHQFGKSYIPLLPKGEDIFRACCDIQAKIGSKGFTILDENFLKQPGRAVELLKLMNKQGKPFVFDIFSSAEVIKKMGVDFLVRLGVRMIWVGVESRHSEFDKTRGIDLKELFADLKRHGIVVQASTMLFQDHHDDESIRADIDYVIGLGTDFIQFMNYTPLPGTTLWKEMESAGRLKHLPYRYVHGAGELFQVHPHINDRKKHARYLRNAFIKKYRVGGPGVLSMAETIIQGYSKAKEDYRFRRLNGLAWDPGLNRYVESDKPTEDEFMKARIRMMRRLADNIRMILLPALVFAPNMNARRKAARTMELADRILGRPTMKQRLISCVLVATGTVEWIRILFSKLRGREGVVHQPRCRITTYNLLEKHVFDVEKETLRLPYRDSMETTAW
ncbi:MAG TPA: radical SAM protein [Spirochaetota bacterium]|nr:radical SAM protein [Spirochaetota bacterium]HSA13360.1 radical SAM protein [Spirochaetota bacterium]